MTAHSRVKGADASSSGAAALRAEGVEIVRLDQIRPGRMKSVYACDSVIAVGGGAIRCSTGPLIRDDV